MDRDLERLLSRFHRLGDLSLDLLRGERLRARGGSEERLGERLLDRFLLTILVCDGGLGGGERLGFGERLLERFRLLLTGERLFERDRLRGDLGIAV